MWRRPAAAPRTCSRWLNEYYGNNGQIHYNIQLGPVITDTNAMPTSGCTLAANDTSGIYADGSGYSSCAG